MVYKRYSVYYSGSEMPVILFATARECAAAMGVCLNTFFGYLSRFNKGYKYPKKYLIYEDEIDLDDITDEESYIIKPPAITETDRLVILSVAECGSTLKAAKMYDKDPSGFYYHIRKVKGITGLDAKIPSDLQILVEMLKEGAEDGIAQN